MVACLERTDGNAKFHQIVDFLTSSTIHYTLTVSPTIYASYIEQFWATAKSKTVNAVKQIHAKVDGKTVVISESPMRSDIHFNDEDVEGEGSGQPFEPQPPSSTALPEQVLAAVGDEAVYIGENERVVRAATTASSLEAEQESGSGPRRHVTTLEDTDAQTRVLALEQFKSSQDLVIKRLPKKVKRLEKKQRERTLGMKLFKIGTSKKKTLDKENVSKQERDESTKTEELNLSNKQSGETKVFYYTTTAEKDVNAAEPVSTAGDTVNAASVIHDVSATGPSTSTDGDLFKDDMTTMANTLMAIRSIRPRITSIVIHNVKEEPRRSTPLPTAQIQRDVEIAQRLFEEDQAQFEKEQRISREKAAQQEATDAKLIEQMDDLKSKSFEEIQMLYEREYKWINDFVPMDSKEVNDSEQQAASNKKRSRADHHKESVKKQKLEEDDAKKEELRACLDIVPVDDIAINVKSLATKYPIVDWKTHTLTENIMYYQTIRANGSSKNYKILTEMCDDFNRQDIINLYRLETMKVKESLNVKLDKSPPPMSPPLEDDDILECEVIENKEKDLEIKENEPLNKEIINIKESKDHPIETIIEPKNVKEAIQDESWTMAMQEELNQFKTNDV
nr:hypothetical protein [Tanacetum cinerariifolium]